MNEPIIESGMRFDATDAWRIEKSELYNVLNKGDKGLKTVEFIRAKSGNYVFVEAKSSFPNLYNPESKKAIDENISDILNKFIHSLSILSSIALRVNSLNQTDIPETFHKLTQPSVQLVLVINFPEKIENAHHTKSICEEIRTVFNSRFSKELMHIWRAKVWVLNKHQAIQRGFVLPDDA